MKWLFLLLFCSIFYCQAFFQTSQSRLVHFIRKNVKISQIVASRLHSQPPGKAVSLPAFPTPDLTNIKRKDEVPSIILSRLKNASREDCLEIMQDLFDSRLLEKDLIFKVVDQFFSSNYSGIREDFVTDDGRFMEEIDVAFAFLSMLRRIDYEAVVTRSPKRRQQMKAFFSEVFSTEKNLNYLINRFREVTITMADMGLSWEDVDASSQKLLLDTMKLFHESGRKEEHDGKIIAMMVYAMGKMKARWSGLDASLSEVFLRLIENQFDDLDTDAICNLLCG